MVGAGPQELKDVASALYSGMNGISRRQYVVKIIMQPFSFQTTRSVLSEVGATEKIGSIVAEMGCVSRVSPVQMAMRNYTRDGGRSSGFGDQELIPSYRKLLWSKAMVVSVAEKSGR
jgi:hypothetical protein